MTTFSKLLSPARIGTMELKNRMVMAPMTVNYANDDETPSQRQIDYYVERARGGVGLIDMEVVTVDGGHRYQQNSLGLYSDDLIAGHKALVDAVHAEGAKIQPQLSHTGPESLAPFYANSEPLGPSVVRTQTTQQVCREITLDELQAIIEMYGQAARRAQQAGYDGIELHAAHSYMLLGSFLSPLRNHRQDEYAGGKLAGRMKLLLEVLTQIRKTVGSDFPITLRISGYERESGGREINDTQRMAPALVEAGVDCFHISGGVGDANITQIIAGPEYTPGFNVSAAAAIKQVVDVPVMVVGRNMNPAQAEQILANQQADLVVMGRALLADPEFPNKVRNNQVANLRACTVCEDCVDSMMSMGGGVVCAVNPRLGYEAKFPLEAAETPRKVVVIGGGPGGMEAARVACERGHQVTLLERQQQLGGAYRLASMVWTDNRRFLDYLTGQVAALPIDLRLGVEADEAMLRDLDADVIIVATGARVTYPDIPGADLPNVIKGPALREMIASYGEGDINALPEGDSVAIVGANLIGVELAEFLASAGKRVHVLEAGNRIAPQIGKKRRNEVTRRLDVVGVPLNTGVRVSAIEEGGVHIAAEGQMPHLLQVDSVILVDQPVADTGLFERVQGLASQVHAIGDSTGFGLSKKAVAEATEVVYQL